MESSTHNRRAIAVSVLASLLMWSATSGCDGWVEVNRPSSSGGSSAAHPGQSDGSRGSDDKLPTDEPVDDGSGKESVCDTLDPGSSPMRRLTEAQYNNTVHDLFDHIDPPDQSFPAGGKVGRFSANVSQSVSSRLATQYRTAAESIAERAVEDVGALTGCDTVDRECAAEFIRAFGRRAYRRPLTDEEQTRFVNVFASANDQWDANVGIRLVVEGMLQSPNFLYRIEEGEPVGDNYVELTDYELASRLSYLLWNSAPDAKLLEAAEAGTLSDPAELERQARRMLEDQRARETLRHIAMQWLGINHLDRLTVPDDAFDETMRESMRQSTVAFLDEVLWKGSGSLRELLTAEFAFVDDEMASVYGVESPGGDGMVKKDMSEHKRQGVLTQPAVLAAHAGGAPSVYRGRFVQDALLCNSPPPPPDKLDDPPETHEGQHPRERANDRMSHKQCGTCHKPMEGIGLTFNQFDALGRFRTEDDHGNRLDDTGRAYAFTGDDTEIDGVSDLTRRLVDSGRVQRCMSRHMFNYAFARHASSDDGCTVEKLRNALEESNYNLKEMLVAITQTAAFRYKESGG